MEKPYRPTCQRFLAPRITRVYEYMQSLYDCRLLSRFRSHTPIERLRRPTVLKNRSTEWDMHIPWHKTTTSLGAFAAPGSPSLASFINRYISCWFGPGRFGSGLNARGVYGVRLDGVCTLVDEFAFEFEFESKRASLLVDADVDGAEPAPPASAGTMSFHVLLSSSPALSIPPPPNAAAPCRTGAARPLPFHEAARGGAWSSHRCTK